MASLTELVRNMSQLEKEMAQFEAQFGIKSPEFYKAMMAGELEAFDALDEYRIRFCSKGIARSPS
jgi:small ligand-binding sensory domain FIST